MSFVFDIVLFVGGAVACVSSQVVYSWVKKQTVSVEAKVAPEVAKVVADVKAKV
jgi:hypothetical protein